MYWLNFIAELNPDILRASLIACLITATAFLLSCGGGKKEDPKGAAKKRPSPKVDGYVIKTEAFSENIEVPGTVVANEVTEIHPEVSGRIVSLNVREGQYVGKGTVLAKIYDGDLQAQLRKLQSQLNTAKLNENRASQLLKIQGISKEEYDGTLLNVRNIEADMSIIRTEISRTVVRSPFSGKMGLKGISPGAYVTPAAVIATINQTSTLKLDFSIPEKYTSRISNGQIVTFTTEGNDREYSARVSATESNINEASRSLTIRSVVNSGMDGLVPGSFAKVKVRFAPKSNAIFVPANAIVPTAKGKQVIISIDGKAIFNDVQTGIRDSSRVEIMSGLKPGDTILVTGLMSTQPNDKINFGKIIN